MKRNPKKEKNLDLQLSLLILLFGVPGVIIGAKVVTFIPETIATFTLGLLILSLGMYSYKTHNKQLKHMWYICHITLLYVASRVRRNVSSTVGE